MTVELFLVDSSAWILALKKDAVPLVKQRIAQLLRETSVAITGIIKLEILGGAKTPKEFRRLQSRLDALDCIETDASLWDSSCELAFKLRRKGVTVPYTDILIAACAIQSRAVLVHADTHFDLIATHSGLKVESLLESIQDLVD
jgi:predicted nucleic acid-binding protein